MTQPTTLPAWATTKRVLKRRFTAAPDLEFFTPSSTSFNPRPYMPHASVSVPHRRPSPVPKHTDSNMAHSLPPPDPLPTDPNVFFLRPPFDNFPNAHFYPMGLTYNVLSENPEWFLDAKDFASPENPDGVPYPLALEPPRGWCPVSKKESRGKRPEEWPRDQELPRLRCTFCRRTYAGVNAKSMWRRHVYEKHKIPMSNRREGPDRGRGSRTSNKENNPSQSRARYVFDPEQQPTETQFRAFAPDMDAEPLFKKSFRFRPVVPMQESSQKDESHSAQDLNEIHVNSEATSEPDPSTDMLHTHLSSPFTSPRKSTTALSSSSPKAFSPRHLTTNVPFSPYDPTQTPAVKYCPPDLPKVHPLRFPSPSHPLYASPREMSLGVLVSGIVGQGLESSYVPATSSPMGPFESPTFSKSRHGHSSSPHLGPPITPLRRSFSGGRILKFQRRHSHSASIGSSSGSPSSSKLLFGTSDSPSVLIRSRAKADVEQALQASELFLDNITVTPPDEPFGAWLNLDLDTSMVSSNGSGDADGDADISGDLESSDRSFNTGSTPDSPVMRSISLPALSRGHTPNTAFLTKDWAPQPSGLGLGISFSPAMLAGEVSASGSEGEVKANLEELENHAAAEMDEIEGQLGFPPQSQEEPDGSGGSGGDDDSSFSDFGDDDFFGSLFPPLKRRKTVESLS